MKNSTLFILLLLIGSIVKGQNMELNYNNKNGIFIGETGAYSNITFSINGDLKVYHWKNEAELQKLIDTLRKYSPTFNQLVINTQQSVKNTNNILSEQEKQRQILISCKGKIRQAMSTNKLSLKKFDNNLSHIYGLVLSIYQNQKIEEERDRNYGTLSFDSVPSNLPSITDQPDSTVINILCAGNLFSVHTPTDTTKLDINRFFGMPLKINVSVSKIKNRLYINAKMVGFDREKIGEINDNEWSNAVKGGTLYDRNYDALGYEVIDKYGVPVLQVQILNRNTIKIQGVFLFNNKFISITDEEMEIHNLSLDEYLKYTEIKTLFRYRSEHYLHQRNK